MAPFMDGVQLPQGVAARATSRSYGAMDLWICPGQ